MKSIRLAVAACAALVYGSVAMAAGSFSAAAKEEVGAATDLWVQSQKGGYTVEYVGSTSAVGAQFDIFDKNIVEGGYDCGSQLSSSHIASCTLNAEEGYLRVIIFSMNNARLPDSTLVRINTNRNRAALSKAGAAAAAAELKNVILSDNQGQNVTPNHL